MLEGETMNICKNCHHFDGEKKCGIDDERVDACACACDDFYSRIDYQKLRATFSDERSE